MLPTIIIKEEKAFFLTFTLNFLQSFRCWFDKYSPFTYQGNKYQIT